nr:unnamed protein product [Callosobruchus chinensis]
MSERSSKDSSTLQTLVVYICGECHNKNETSSRDPTRYHQRMWPQNNVQKEDQEVGCVRCEMKNFLLRDIIYAVMNYIFLI